MVYWNQKAVVIEYRIVGLVYRLKIYGLILGMFYSGLAKTQTIDTIDIQQSNGIIVVSDTDNKLVLKYNSGKPIISQVRYGEEYFFKLNLSDHSNELEAGLPEVPVFSGLIDLTGKEIVKVSISRVKSKRIYPSDEGYYGMMVPVRDLGTKGSQDQEREREIEEPLFLREEFYTSSKPYITDTVSIHTVGKIRGNRIGSLRVNPVIYYPSSNFVDIITNMTIEILFKGIPDEPLSKGALKSQSTNSLLAKGLINYNPDDVIPGFSLAPVGMVIVADITMKKFLAPLLEWKTRKGFKITELYIGEDGLTKSYTAIKERLTDIYNNATPEDPAPEFLILAGDVNYIPPSEGTSWLSDMYYGEFDGSGDYLPDLYTGRLPARDTTQMKAIVAKILQYERFEFGDTIDHYQSALAFTGYDAGNYVIMNGQINYAGSYLNESNGITSHILLHSNDDSTRTARFDSVKTLINEGIGFINYTGHGNAYGWLYTGINNDFVSTISNSSRYPVVISNACQTANFNNLNCFGSTFVRKSNKGALAFIGCSNDSYWTEDFFWAVGVSQVIENPLYEESGLGFYDRLFHLHNEFPNQWYTTLGQIMYAGNMAVSATPSTKVKYYWETYTLLGDPSITPFIGTPTLFQDNIPDSIPRLLKTLALTTDPFAYVAISHFDTLWDASHASPSGAVILNLPEVYRDSCLIILTGQNKIPYIKTLYFSDPDTAWLNINAINTNDPDGNSNGLADFSENISLDLELQNAGSGVASNAYVLLSSDSEYITINIDSVSLGDIGGLSEFTFEDLYSITIKDSIPDLEIASFNLQLNYGLNSIIQIFDMSLHSPDPVVLSCYTDDSVTGNGNGLAEAGEKVSIIVRVSNNGSSSASGVLFLSSVSEFIVFDQISVNSGTIPPGEIVELSVAATISPDTPEATSIAFDANLDCSPYSNTRELSIFSGKSTEDFELQSFTTFPWKNQSAFPWKIIEGNSYRNSFSAQSGLTPLNANQKSELQLSINLPEDDTMSFWYKVSSEYTYDWFAFEMDSTVQFRASGEVAWTESKVSLSKGVHSLKWTYSKDASLSEGSDCAWIDFIRFPANSFLKNDLVLNRIVSPVLNKQYSDEPVTVEATNLGRDTITQMELSYALNDDPIVTETFYGQVRPGETVKLTFTTTTNLAEPGNYYIKIYPSSSDEYPKNDTVSAVFISYVYLIQIGPNPFDDKLSFISQGLYKDITVKLFSSSGILVFEKRFDEFLPMEIANMDLPPLSSGLYILKVYTDFGTNTYKVIKQ